MKKIFLALQHKTINEKIIKRVEDLRNKMGDEWLNDLMICYTEKELFRNISNEKIIKRFEEMKERHMLVPKKNMVVCFILLLFDNFNSFK